MVPHSDDRKVTHYSTHEIAQCASRLLSVQELEQAQRLFYNDPEWGEFYGNKFRVEAAQIMNVPSSGVIGVFLPDGRLVGVGVAAKEPFDYAYWSLTWIFVDIASRGTGVGRVIVDSLLVHMKARQEQSHNPNARVLLSTTEDVERFYERGWGFRTIAEGPLAGERLMMLDLVGPGLPLRSR
jgi:hypothetical protein